MLEMFVTLYGIAMIWTLIFAGAFASIDLDKAHKAGMANAAINWLNIFYQGLAWPAWMGAIIYSWIMRRRSA